MTFREMFGLGEGKLPTGRVLDLGAAKFEVGLFDDVSLTPHEEMDRCIAMFERRPMVNSGVKQFARFVLGKNPHFSSEDPKTEQFLNEWMKLRPTLKTHMFEAVQMALVTGNCYFENVVGKDVTGKQFFDGVTHVDDPSRVYRYLQARDASEYWVYKIPREMQLFQHPISGEPMKPLQFPINYTVGSRILREMVYGIPVHRDKIKHMKFGWSRDGIYGRGFLASALDDNEVMSEIIKSMALIARYKSIGTKIISLFNDDGEVRPEDIKQFREDLQGHKIEENIVLNKKHQVSSLSNAGEYDSMQREIDFLRKDIYTGIIPTYLTPWGGDTKYSNAVELKIPFAMEISSVQDDFVQFFNELILKPLRSQYPWLAEDASLVLEATDMETRADKMAYATNLFLNNVITLNELRNMAGLEPMKSGGDVFWRQLGNPEGAGGAITTGSSAMKVSSSPPSASPSPFSEAFVPESDEKWKERMREVLGLKKKETDLYKVVRSRDIGGKRLRLVKRGEVGGWAVFMGYNPLKFFGIEEETKARAFYDKQAERFVALLDALEETTPTDEISDGFFDEMNEVFGEIVEEVFAHIDDNKVKKEAFGVDPGVMERLEDIFLRFNTRIQGAVNRAVRALFGGIVRPKKDMTDAGHDTPVESDDLETKASLDKAQLMMRDKLQGQMGAYANRKLQDIRRKLADGIAAGKTHAQIKADVKQDISDYKARKNVYEYETQRIARTEIQGSFALGQCIKWHRQGYKRVQWITSRDERVRKSHKDRDRQVFLIEDLLSGEEFGPAFSLGNHSPSETINCRCSLILVD
jgi:SPP1 gp7 family putative phage head morphogenesis protein